MILNQPSEFQSLDDLLNATYDTILNNGKSINSKRGLNLEITQYAATLLNPRVRTSMSLDRKLVRSKFAEFAWYLSKEKDINYIKPYIAAYDLEEQQDNKILGAYGPKIFGLINGQKSQFERIVEQILKRPTTKQAFLTISEIEDYKFRNDKFASPPCTIGLHFYVRNDKLNLSTYMRSNDAYLGLPHDLFCFTMLQEIVSFRTNLPLGKYTHYATSMHVYEKHRTRIREYLDEGLHEPIEMPIIKSCSMEMLNLVSKEFDFNIAESNFEELDPYWQDYVLFSNRYNNDNIETMSWENKFRNKNMKLIAKNSIGK
ncbi:thymidylate synthase [Arenibacter sp. M-2]|uniref:thymidylate synthase n=1 Tax=Arenibacter sp. M-2 TaxID=3053612 RepID=UPI002570ECD8|nr:thymidylate synthase [Arenibacter sp. M-2]MDL5514604.1 thymidylate synthase [Arenibacter sp. M-2]